MHPALSVIFFTSVSGVGYGLLFLAGCAVAVDPLLLDPIALLLALGLGIAFTIAGLISSMKHLGQPQRAWRAFGQWRSSWLSREGVASSACFLPALLLYALAWRNTGALAYHQVDEPALLALRACGTALAFCAVLVVFCTARIYTSLKTIAAWHSRYVLPGYLLFALLGGAATLWLLLMVANSDPRSPLFGGLPLLVAASALAVALLKRSYWRFIDSRPSIATPESATGLGRFGRVRGAEAPHTEENYLTREMGFVLARKHGAKLRAIAMVLFAVTPALLALIAFVSASPVLSLAAAIVAAPTVAAGTFVERWLFFAEAKHVVMLYYAGTRA